MGGMARRNPGGYSFPGGHGPNVGHGTPYLLTDSVGSPVKVFLKFVSPSHTSSKSALGMFFDLNRRSKNKPVADFSSSGTTIRISIPLS